MSICKRIWIRRPSNIDSERRIVGQIVISVKRGYKLDGRCSSVNSARSPAQKLDYCLEVTIGASEYREWPESMRQLREPPGVPIAIVSPQMPLAPQTRIHGLCPGLKTYGDKGRSIRAIADSVVTPLGQTSLVIITRFVLPSVPRW